MSRLASTTVVLEIVTADGDAHWRDGWTGHQSFQSTPPSVFDERQAARIPITINHDGPVVGSVCYLEHGLGYGNGGLYGVGVVEGIGAELIDGQLMCSPVIGANAMATEIDTTRYPRSGGVRTSTKVVGSMNATRAELRAVGLVDRTASVTSTRVRAFDGDYRDHCDQGRMKTWRLPPIIDRAIAAAGYDLRHRQPDHIRIHRPPTGRPQAIEVRKASRLEVSPTGRSIDMIAVPYDEPTEVIVRDRWITETISPGAFSGVHGDVTVNRAHNLEQPLGRVTSLDPTDPRGLRAVIRIARTRDGDDVLELAADGLLSASVAFSVPVGGEQWAPDQRSRKITRAKLHHIALTGDPAYKGAKVLAVRSAR